MPLGENEKENLLNINYKTYSWLSPIEQIYLNLNTIPIKKGKKLSNENLAD